MINRKKTGTSNTQSRMARLRDRRQLMGEKQISVLLPARAAELLVQMTDFSGRTQRDLLSDAIELLAFDYDHWGVTLPEEIEYEWSTRNEENSHRENIFGDWEENPRFGKRIPPWIVESERLYAAERKEIAARVNQRSSRGQSDDGLNVYQRGVDRNKLR